MRQGLRRTSAMALITAMILSMALAVAYGVPRPPNAFYGSFTMAGEPAPDGTPIEARIGGVPYASTTTFEGKYGWEPPFEVPADDPATDEKEGGIDGETVEFYVDGELAGSHTFESGKFTELDLSIGAPPNQPPVADAGGPYSGEKGEVIAFDGTGSYDPDGSIVSYAWDFGDGESGTGATPSHAYDEAGTYTVTLMVTDDDDATDSDTATVTVSEPAPPPPPPPPPKDTTPPTTSNPSPTGDINTTTPTISANYTDNRKIDTDSVRLVLDGADVTEGATVTSSWVTYVPEPLANGTTHLVGLTVADPRGNEASLEWNFTVMLPPLPPRPAEFEVSDLSITPAELETGEEVAISVLVSNVGELGGTHVVALEVNGVVEGETMVTLEGGASETVSFTVIKDVEGTYNVEVDGLTGSFTVTAPPTPPKPAEFEVSGLVISPSEVEEGEGVTITVDVSNVGEEAGSHTVELKIDGEVVDSETVTLAGGASAMILFEVTRSAGTYQVEVEGLTGSFTVTSPPPPPPPPPKPFPWEIAAAAAIIIAIIVIAVIARKYMG